jgi:hypothetical protein
MQTMQQFFIRIRLSGAHGFARACGHWAMTPKSMKRPSDQNTAYLIDFNAYMQRQASSLGRNMLQEK